MAESGCGELYYDKFLCVGPAANCTPAAQGVTGALAAGGVAGVGGTNPGGLTAGNSLAPDMFPYI